MTTRTIPERETVEALMNRAVHAMRAGDLRAAMRSYQDILRRDANNLSALINLGALTFQSGKVAEALPLMQQAFQQAPDRPDTRTNLIVAHEANGAQAHAARSFDAAVGHYRAILALDPGNTAARLNLVDSLYEGNLEAALDDFVPGLDLGPRKLNILIACMPKSGSTWLLESLRALTGFDHAVYTFAFKQSEQDLYLPEVANAASMDCVVQQHCRATAANVQIMQAFGIRPVILVRNIFDVLISMADFYAKGAYRNSFMTEFENLDRETQVDAVIDQFGAWYLQFFASWVQAEESGKLPVLWVGFEEMMADKPAALARVCAFHGIRKSDTEIEAVVNRLDASKNRTRFNKGVAGRGKSELSEAQQKRIRRMAAYYPSIDMGRIGL